MGNLVIEGGDGRNTALVNDANKLQVFAVTQTDIVDASDVGDGYYLSSGIVNLNTANLSQIFFVKNNDLVSWVVPTITLSVGLSTGAPNVDLSASFTINPSTGTLVSGGTPKTAFNTNIGIVTPLAATILAGVEGDTITDGSPGDPVLVPTDRISPVFDAGPIIFKPGTSLALGVTPAASNSSLNVAFTLVLYRKTSAR